MLYDNYGRPVINNVVISITSGEIRINYNGNGKIQLKNRSTGLWHDLYIMDNNGIALLTWSENPGEA